MPLMANHKFFPTPELVAAIEANLQNKKLSWRAFALSHRISYHNLLRYIGDNYGKVPPTSRKNTSDPLPPPETYGEVETDNLPNASLDSLAEILAVGDRRAAIATLTDIIANASDNVKVAALKLYFDETRGTGPEIGPPPPTTDVELLSRLVDILRTAGMNISRVAYEEAFHVKKDDQPANPSEDPEAPSEGDGVPPS
jgi:hypothetical protein